MSESQNSQTRTSTERLNRFRPYIIALALLSIVLLGYASGTFIDYRGVLQQLYLDSKDFSETLTSNLMAISDQSRALRSSLDAASTALANIPRTPANGASIDQVTQQLSNARTALDAINTQTQDSSESVHNWITSFPDSIAPESPSPYLRFGVLIDGAFPFTTPAFAAKWKPKPKPKPAPKPNVQKISDKFQSLRPILWFVLGVPLLLIVLGGFWMWSSDHEIKAFGMCMITASSGFYSGIAISLLTGMT
jgi:hypothetical protein